MKNKILEHLEIASKLVIQASLQMPSNDPVDLGKYRLCYVDRNNRYYFTTDYANQWGDDWNDNPADCNAGEPYYPHPNSDKDWEKDGTPKWTIITISFIPPENMYGETDSAQRFSVETINKCGHPWFYATSKNYKTNETQSLSIKGGMSIPEFIDAVESVGGIVLIPRLGWASAVFPKGNRKDNQY